MLFYLFLLAVKNFGGNAEHTNYAPVEFTDFWFAHSEAVAPLKGLFAQPIAFQLEGTSALVYIASRKGQVGVMSLSDRKLLWQKNLPKALLVQQKGFCIVDTMGIFPAGLEPFIHFVDLKNGKEKWSYPLDDAPTVPMTDGEGIYFADARGGVYRLNREGEINWKTSLGEGIDPLRMVPAMTQSLLNIATSSGMIYGLLSGTGSVQWKASLGQPFFGGVMGIPGRAFVVLSRGPKTVRLHLFSLGGKELWSMDFPIEADLKDVPWNWALSTTGQVIFLSAGSTVYAVDLDGNFLWKQQVDGYASGILSGKKGLILSISKEKGNAVALVDSENGQILHRIRGEGWFASPAVWLDDRKMLVVGNEDGKLYFFTLSR